MLFVLVQFSHPRPLQIHFLDISHLHVRRFLATREHDCAEVDAGSRHVLGAPTRMKWPESFDTTPAVRQDAHDQLS